jgi:hypothetical protein
MWTTQGDGGQTIRTNFPCLPKKVRLKVMSSELMLFPLPRIIGFLSEKINLFSTTFIK